MPGDPRRAERIAEHLEGSSLLSSNREFHCYRGAYRGVDIGVVSTGVGAPGAAMIAEETIRAGARLLLRVGTAGSLQDDVRDGELVVVTGAGRCDGTTQRLMPQGWPALADPDVVAALWEAAAVVNAKAHRGVVVTLDLFYQGVLDTGLDVWSAAGALAVEMECSAILCVASLRRAQAGAILAVDGDARRASTGEYDPHRDVVADAIVEEITAALEAAVALGG